MFWIEVVPSFAGSFFFEFLIRSTNGSILLVRNEEMVERIVALGEKMRIFQQEKDTFGNMEFRTN